MKPVKLTSAGSTADTIAPMLTGPLSVRLKQPFVAMRSSPSIGGVLVSLCLAVLALWAVPARAADAPYPTRVIKLVVPFPPGSTADAVARLLADRFTARLGQPVIVENKSGVAGSMGVDAVAKAPADGHTLLLTTSSPLVLNPSLYHKLSYNVDRDFVPVGMIGFAPTILVANPSVPAANVPELLAYLRKNPGKLSYGSSGTGSFAHVTMERFKNAVGVHVVHIPYRGNAQADVDLLGGNISLMFTSLTTSAPHVASGKLKALAVTSRERSPFAQSVPTLAESGVAALRDFDVTFWVGLLAPAGTPAPVVKKLNDEVNGLLQAAEFKEQLAKQKIVASRPMTPEGIAMLIAAEKTRWAKVMRDAKIERQD
ncbi:MAG TPA: tripartite tricarboxylate transporter substrate binding protein [Ramlibacter sp.]|nr:tripartite tricarboxylate transporter substrate binding protein [Ramlibacter sp.]